MEEQQLYGRVFLGTDCKIRAFGCMGQKQQAFIPTGTNTFQLWLWLPWWSMLSFTPARIFQQIKNPTEELKACGRYVSVVVGTCCYDQSIQRGQQQGSGDAKKLNKTPCPD
ncbi:hypothetical protein Anapl_00491 [Anas platyrhynchos]|uniref:Uncharacterized protein n=1 Tax=Anas platyrhynchos TaxID=8839 RepID=R0JUV8_ANAPL|nr:hypothetical protein Anapl_00491 [Anas platyrhynchos]